MSDTLSEWGKWLLEAILITLHAGGLWKRLYRQIRWRVRIKQGGRMVGTSRRELNQVMLSFDAESLFEHGSGHELLDDVRLQLWRGYLKLDELKLLATAGEETASEQERCWALVQIGQRCAKYAAPCVDAIGEKFGTPLAVKAAAARAAQEILRRAAEIAQRETGWAA